MTNVLNDCDSDFIRFGSLTNLPAMLNWQALNAPNDIAVIGDTVQLTMAELVETAAQIASGIATATTKQTDCIGLYADPSVDMITGLWGILWSGRAYVPLAPEYPEERIRYIVEQSGVDTIVTQRHLHARLASIAPVHVRLLVLEDLLRGNGAPMLEPALRDPAYLVYTSGSTGHPKGVVIPQQAITSQMHWLRQHEYLRPGARILQKTPVSFDAAQWELLAPAVGATVVAGSPGLFRDTVRLITAIRRHAITRLQCVPTLLASLISEEGFRQCTDVEMIFSGGEALSQKLAADVLTCLPHVRLVNLYGPTECTINATAHEVCAEELGQPGRVVTIGRPVNGIHCHILDDTMRPVPEGEEGELYLGGAQLALGYRNAPEQTEARFIPSPFTHGERLYRTGDVCAWNPDGTLRFAGRTDHQIKLRGYRVELEEVSVAIEAHPWIRHASVVVSEDQRTGAQSLTACIELNEKEAVLMDQGVAGSHHQSKANKAQVKAQLSRAGLRDDAEDSRHSVTELPGARPGAFQRKTVFARKTYRFFDGGAVMPTDLLELTGDWFTAMRGPQTTISPAVLHLGSLGPVLRWFGSIDSADRLLPKYAYASPGALYATQLYLQCKDIAGIADGIHYYHPLRHALIRICDCRADIDGNQSTSLRLHFVGKRQAIEPIYKNNILEVLQIETGHMLAVFDEALAPLGLSVTSSARVPGLLEHLGLPSSDLELGSFDCVPSAQRWNPAVELFIQSMGRGVETMVEGTWRVTPHGLEYISNDIITRNHVIAINQQVFHRASVGLSVVSRELDDTLQYVSLGFALHKFQRNSVKFGFMSSGYSSKTGNTLPAAHRLDKILSAKGIKSGPMYFFIGGKVSNEQIASEGMHEDAVHMQGPAEMVREELSRSLPDYMIPNRVLVFDRLPISANGKVDHKAVAASEELREALRPRPYTPPFTTTEVWLAELWASQLNYSPVSREDEFFSSGGNSLIAISSLHQINRHFDIDLPVQVLFEVPRLANLAERIDAARRGDALVGCSRLVLLNQANSGRPVFCWPGLGGYPMNLRPLANAVGRPFYGIQSVGLNAGETPCRTIADMARDDIIEILRLQAQGPITLWGYSFGARLAFESAWQIEQSGRVVDQIVLICPGNPYVESRSSTDPAQREASLANLSFVSILLSVFLGQIDIVLATHCASQHHTPASFAAYVQKMRPELGLDMIQRIVAIVFRTYEFDYSFEELRRRRIHAPVTIIKARGDDYSFIESARGFAANGPYEFHSDSDHYSILRGVEAQGLSAMIARSARSIATQFQLDRRNQTFGEVEHAPH